MEGFQAKNRLDPPLCFKVLSYPLSSVNVPHGSYQVPLHNTPLPTSGTTALGGPPLTNPSLVKRVEGNMGRGHGVQQGVTKLTTVNLVSMGTSLSSKSNNLSHQLMQQSLSALSRKINNLSN